MSALSGCFKQPPETCFSHPPKFRRFWERGLAQNLCVFSSAGLCIWSRGVARDLSHMRWAAHLGCVTRGSRGWAGCEARAWLISLGIGKLGFLLPSASSHEKGGSQGVWGTSTGGKGGWLVEISSPA